MSNNSINETISPREGEEIDVNQLTEYLQQKLPDFKGPVTIRQFPGGVSNLTYLITTKNSEYIVRRPPHGKKAKSAHNMSREYIILKHIHNIFPYCPKPYLYCEDPSIIGASFYVMQKLNGIILRRDLPQNLTLEPKQATQLCHRLIEVHVELHTLDYEKANLSEIAKPEGYVNRQITGWSERYIQARTKDVPDCEQIMQWLAEHLPKETYHHCLIHNDYKFDNIILNPRDITKITGVLDWEMATIGDPLMDLGSSLAYWIQSDDPMEMQMIRRLPTHLPGMLSRSELVAYYAELTGNTIDNFNYYYIFGLFRLAVIAQQIYFRFAHGQTKDKRFAEFGKIVSILAASATQEIKKYHEGF